MRKILTVALLSIALMIGIGFTRPISVEAGPFSCEDQYYYAPYGENCTLACTQRTCEYPGGIVIVNSNTVLVCPNYSIDYGWNEGGCLQ